jgi:membrane-associated phospholipid phosphatase
MTKPPEQNPILTEGESACGSIGGVSRTNGSVPAKPAKIPTWFWLAALGLLLLTLIVQLGDLDRPIFLWVNYLGRFAGDTFWIGTTTLGDGLVVCVLALPFVRRKPELVWALLLSMLLMALYVKGIKFFVNRPRPLTNLLGADFRVIGARYRFNSFPSGHAAAAAMLAGIFCLFFRQMWVRVAIIGLALLIGASRIAMGIHWTVDVLAGFFGGWLAAGLGYWLAARLRFATTLIAKVIIGILLSGAAVVMLVNNHTDYAQAFRFQQGIALTCLLYILCDLGFWFRRQRTIFFL